jgi:hypothetical protein
MECLFLLRTSMALLNGTSLNGAAQWHKLKSFLVAFHASALPFIIPCSQQGVY